MEEVEVSLRSQPVETPDLEVGPKMAIIIGFTVVITQEVHRVIFGDMLRVSLDEFLSAIPQRRNRVSIFVQAQHKAVLFLVVLHELERIVLQIAEKLHAWLDAPVVLKLVHQGMAEEEAGLETTHMSITDRITIDNLALRHVLANLARLVLVYE